MTRFGRMLIQSAEEALAIEGEAPPARVYAPPTDVAAIRKQPGLSSRSSPSGSD